MKISFCSIAFRKSPKTILDIIPIIADLGYDAIEIWGHHFGDIPLADIKDTLEASNLRVAMVSPYMDFTGSKENRHQSLATAEDFLEKAIILGSPNIRVFTGVVGSADATVEQWRSAVKGLKNICALAANTGINFALETHPKTLVDKVDSTLRLLDDVSADNLRINLDIYHMWESHKDVIWVLEKLAPFISHIHAKNADLPPSLNGNNPLLHDRQASQDIYGVTTLADGAMSYPAFIKALQSSDFNGYFSLEWFGENEEQAAKSELKYLRNILRSASSPA